MFESKQSPILFLFIHFLLALKLYWNAFLQCFSDKDELLRNMMGLVGNVAEVKRLRWRLMKTEFISVFTDLLDSHSEGIEVIKSSSHNFSVPHFQSNVFSDQSG